MSFLVLGVFLAFSVAATYFDLRWRMIPDWLNYSFLLVGIGLNLFFIGIFSVVPVLAAVISWFLFAYAVYRLGGWAGGDVKFFAALAPFSALYGLDWLSFLGVFLYSAMLLVPILCIVYCRELWALRKDVQALTRPALISATSGAIASYAVIKTLFLASVFFAGNVWALAALVIALMLVKIPAWLSLVLFAAAVAFWGMEFGLLLFVFSLAFALALLPRLFSLISAKILRYNSAVKDLREGDVPTETISAVKGKLVRFNPLDWKSMLSKALAEVKAGKGIVDVFVDLRKGFVADGRVVADALAARGLSSAEIKELKRLGVKEVALKRTLPFAPVLAAGFLAYSGALAWL